MIRFILLCSFLGLMTNMSLSGLIVQPDWSFAILLAVLLSDRHAWFWILPAVWFHDILLYWSALVCFPYIAAVALLLNYTDKRIGSGQQQRWFALIFSSASLLDAGVPVWDWVLTMMLCVWLWFIFADRRDGEHAEPA